MVSAAESELQSVGYQVHKPSSPTQQQTAECKSHATCVTILQPVLKLLELVFLLLRLPSDENLVSSSSSLKIGSSLLEQCF